MSVGSDLRQLRESKRITLETVSLKTKIAVKYLEALESDQYEVFPSHTYATGFLRAYAKVVGADPQLITRQFKEEVEPKSVAIHPSIDTPVTRSHNPFDKKKLPEQRPEPTAQDFLISFDEETEAEVIKEPLKGDPLIKRDRDLVPPGAWRKVASKLFTLLLVVVACYYSWGFIKQHPIKISFPKKAPKQTVAEVPAEVVPVGTKAVVKEPARAVAPPVATATPVVKQALISKPTIAKPAVAKQEKQSSTPPLEVSIADKYHHVVLKGREESWILVNMDGEKTWEFMLNKGEVKTYKAKDFFTVKVGNAAGVDLWYDNEAMGVLGAPGQVVEMRLPAEKAQK